MTDLVTGATGYLGGALALKLRQQGRSVRALVRPGAKVKSLADAGIELFEGQLTQRDDVLAATQGCERVFHLAAVFRTAGHPDAHYHDVNVGGTQNVLDAAHETGCARVVHCSTGGVHSHIARPPAAEDYPVGADDVYQRSKWEGEKLAHAAMANGQPVTVFRPGAIYGPGDDRLLKLFRAIRQRRFRMIGPGQVRLHLAYVDDLVDGVVLLGTRPEALGEIFLLAGPDAPTLTQLTTHIAQAVGVSLKRGRIPLLPVKIAATLCEALCVPFGIDPPLHRRRVGFFTHHREFDLTKAQEKLGYTPRVNAAQGIQQTAQWYAQKGWIDPPPSP